MRAFLLAMLVASAASAGSLPWYAHYDRGLALIDEGQGREAVAELEAAVAKRAEPGTSVRVYGNRYIVYVPYLYLAVASHMAGEMGQARSYLDRSLNEGVAAGTEVGQSLLPAYELLLKSVAEGNSRQESGVDQNVSYREYESKDVRLSDEEFLELRQEIESRCGFGRGAESSRLPWYFHYELGLVLAQENDPQRALDALITAADRKPVSQRGARMYGMWFTDYLPYFQIAKAHGELENWRCALDALEVSRKMGEIDEDDEEYVEFRELLERARDAH